MSTAVGFQIIRPIELKTPKGEVIVKFSVAYEIYRGNLAHVNSCQLEGKKIDLVGYMSCVGAELLQHPVDLGTFAGNSDVAPLTGRQRLDFNEF